ncbi:MAG: BLUF domain-containing protein [Deltaproteobacteria bacterium]|nr:BLUF domain-containing protein [Deltaproteobacteria bacterium]
MFHLIYSSVATRDFAADELVELAARSAANNASLDITGILLFSEGSFFQVLEGDAEELDPLFQRIAQDPRHTAVTMVIREPIARRDFADWSMGLSVLSRGELMQVPELNDFFATGACLDALDHGRAKKLLQAFQAGRWRSSIAARRP